MASNEDRIFDLDEPVHHENGESGEEYWEKELGRPLMPGESVHHINGDPLDNRPENLALDQRIICACCLPPSVARAREAAQKSAEAD